MSVLLHPSKTCLKYAELPSVFRHSWKVEEHYEPISQLINIKVVVINLNKHQYLIRNKLWFVKPGVKKLKECPCHNNLM